MRLADKVVLITGNGTGLGREASLLFAREGAQIAGCGRTKETGMQTVQLIEEAGGEGLFVVGDIRYRADVDRVVSETVDRFGRIDVLVNNASVLLSGISGEGNFEPITDLSEEAWDMLIDTNLKGVWLMTTAVLNHMLTRGGGTIVNIGSNSGILGYPLVHAYGAAKSALAGLTRSIACTYTGAGIRANSIAAGIFDSPMAASLGPFVAQAGPLFNPMGRLGTMNEIAQAMLFLASDESSFVHGHELVVDGGQAVVALPPIDLAAMTS